MECPVCAGTLQPDASVSYWVVDGVRTADWMRCERCDFARIQSSREPMQVGAGQNRQACA